MKRLCLKCEHVFNSKGIHNRLCNCCSRFNCEHGFYLQDIIISAGDKKMNEILLGTRGRLVST